MAVTSDVNFKYEKKNQFSGQNAKVQFSVTERSNLIGCTGAINRLVKQYYFTLQYKSSQLVKNKIEFHFNFYRICMSSIVLVPNKAI